MILDRNGKVLAISEMSKSLYADPTMLNEDPAMVADLLAPYLRISKDEIERRLKEDTAFVWLDRQMDHEKYEAVESLIKEDKLHGLAFRDETAVSIRTVRWLPRSSVLSVKMTTAWKAWK